MWSPMIAAAWDDRGETSAPAEQQCMLRIKTWKETIWHKVKIDLVQYWNLDIVQASEIPLKFTSDFTISEIFR